MIIIHKISGKYLKYFKTVFRNSEYFQDLRDIIFILPKAWTAIVFVSPSQKGSSLWLKFKFRTIIFKLKAESSDYEIQILKSNS